MIKFKSLYPVIWTKNLEESIGFYTHILNFTLVDANIDAHWAFLAKDGVQIMLTRPNEHGKMDRICFSGSFYFTVDHVDDLWKDLHTITKICYSIETFEWGIREFAIYDNNGYILQFGQPVSEISKEE